VKLTRNTLMGGVIILMGLLYGGAEGTAGSLGARLKQSVPRSCLGFSGMCLLNTLGVVAWASQQLGRDLIVDAQTGREFLILVALAGVGLGTRFDAMRRIGLRPFWVGLATALVTSGASYALIRFFGPAGGR
jgi:uncharacterized membrane protein YadS